MSVAPVSYASGDLESPFIDRRRVEWVSSEIRPVGLFVAGKFSSEFPYHGGVDVVIHASTLSSNADRSISTISNGGSTVRHGEFRAACDCAITDDAAVRKSGSVFETPTFFLG